MHPILIFNSEKLLQQALTHRSFANENRYIVKGNNERLEFLGDAILTFISAEYLYQLAPQMTEAEMTRRRSALVDKQQLAKFAIQLGLKQKMRLGAGAKAQGGRDNPNLLSSTFEALVGAYYLDHGSNIEVLRPLLIELFESVPQDILFSRSQTDPKGMLQQFVQGKGLRTPPQYETSKTYPSNYISEFIARVYIEGKIYGQGKGKSKKEAQRQAAKNALQKIGLL